MPDQAYTRPEMVLFDYGGTLFRESAFPGGASFQALLDLSDNPRGAAVSDLSALWNTVKTAVRGVYMQPGPSLEYPLRTMLTYLCTAAGLRPHVPVSALEIAFDRAHTNRTPEPGIGGLLRTLRTQGIRTAVISNTDLSGEAMRAAIERHLPAHTFEAVFTSADLVFCKPAVEIFHAAAAFCNVLPAHCWYCGDSFRNDVTGACGAGMRPVLYDTTGSPLATCTRDGYAYLSVNHWCALDEHIQTLF